MRYNIFTINNLPSTKKRKELKKLKHQNVLCGGGVLFKMFQYTCSRHKTLKAILPTVYGL